MTRMQAFVLGVSVTCALIAFALRKGGAMTRLDQRKTKLIFETTDQVREREAWRAVIVEAKAGHALLRLKGLRRAFPLCYGTAYQHAARIAAEQQRAEKRAKKGDKSWR